LVRRRNPAGKRASRTGGHQCINGNKCHNKMSYHHASLIYVQRLIESAKPLR
jgi:hypothetical protein